MARDVSIRTSESILIRDFLRSSCREMCARKFANEKFQVRRACNEVKSTVKWQFIYFTIYFIRSCLMIEKMFKYDKISVIVEYSTVKLALNEGKIYSWNFFSYNWISPLPKQHIQNRIDTSSRNILISVQKIRFFANNVAQLCS